MVAPLASSGEENYITETPSSARVGHTHAHITNWDLIGVFTHLAGYPYLWNPCLRRKIKNLTKNVIFVTWINILFLVCLIVRILLLRTCVIFCFSPSSSKKKNKINTFLSTVLYKICIKILYVSNFLLLITPFSFNTIKLIYNKNTGGEWIGCKKRAKTVLDFCYRMLSDTQWVLG